MDFISIGDTAVDEFIRLKEAQITHDKGTDTISIPWGDKIPYDFSLIVPGVGNAANAAVAAARLGLRSGFVSNVGKDKYGEEIIASFSRESVDTSLIKVNEEIPTNHHYVLWYESERTILIRHEAYPYTIPQGLTVPSWVYLSSLGEHSGTFHDDIANWIKEHPEIKLAFQPGTFQIALGKGKLGALYALTEFIACNKEEAEQILECGTTDIQNLLKGMRDLGPKTVLITDGTNGACAFDGQDILKVPMYPDLKTPLDRTGAGDATASSIVSAIALGKPLREALLWGPINAMAVTQEVGAQKGLLSRTALEKLLDEAPEGYRVKRL